jgi:hypothetical protein
MIGPFEKGFQDMLCLTIFKVRPGCRLKLFCGTSRILASRNLLKLRTDVGFRGTWEQEVAGSNPFAPIHFKGLRDSFSPAEADCDVDCDLAEGEGTLSRPLSACRLESIRMCTNSGPAFPFGHDQQCP